MENRSRSFRHVNVGQTVTRLVPGEGPMRLRVTSVDGRLIHCGELTFDRDRGLEVDPVLGPSLWGVVQSRLQPELRPLVGGAVSLHTSIRRALQIVLFVVYLTVLAAIGVAIVSRDDQLAATLGVGLLLIWVAMKVASMDGRTIHASSHPGRRPRKET